MVPIGMASQIPRDFIDQLLAQTDLVEIIGSRVKLKKQGKDYYARCPFHTEKSASFTVSADKQFYHCFGCGVNGNALGFLMALDKLAFPEAVEELALRLGLTVPRPTNSGLHGAVSSGQPQRRQLYQLLEQLTVYYQQMLLQPDHHSARGYLQHRGIIQSVIQQFRIGFAAPGWDAVSRRFSSQPLELQALSSAGLIVQNARGSYYDRFRNRLLFPIRNLRGQVVAFGGRILDKGEPKYLNSPETPLFRKSQTLYGLYELIQRERHPTYILVVEGYMDVLSLVCFGIYSVVATLGTATTSEQIAQLLRVTDSLIFCYDGDSAGREAAWKALERILPQLRDGVQVKFMFLPAGEDPDSLVQRGGPEDFQAIQQQADDISTLLFSTLLQQIDLSRPEGRARLSARALPLIERVPGGTLRMALREQLGHKLGIVDEGQLERLLPKQASIINRSHQQPRLKQTPMRLLLALLLQNPSLAQQVPKVISRAPLSAFPGWRLFNALLAYCHRYPEVTLGQLLGHWQNHRIYPQLEALAIWDHLIDSEHITETFLDTLYHVYTQGIEQRMDQLIAKDRQKQLTLGERGEYIQLLAMAKSKPAELF
ncbi:MAG: DNA primase [Candidatus Symbiodolus clandestinus]